MWLDITATELYMKIDVSHQVGEGGKLSGALWSVERGLCLLREQQKWLRRLLYQLCCIALYASNVRLKKKIYYARNEVPENSYWCEVV